MKLDLKPMKGKVSKRIYLQFILCALLPVIALALFSYIQVEGELEKQAQKRLHEACSNFGAAVFERLKLLENDIYTLSLIQDFRVDITNIRLEAGILEQLESRIKGLSYINASGISFSIFGDVPPLPRTTSEEKLHLESGRALVRIDYNDSNPGKIFMLKQVDPREPNQGLFYCEINMMYLWDLDEFNTLPASTELMVLGMANNIIFSTHPSPPDFDAFSLFNKPRTSISSFNWEYQGKKYMAGFRSVFTQFNWFYPNFIIIMSSPKDIIFAPIDFFKKVFLLVIVLALLTVLLLSAVQIRKITEPIEKLKQGSKRIAGQEFKTEVNIKSGDEFEELGETFNEMAKRLGEQFQALTSMSEISRAILSSLNTKEVINFLIYGLNDYFNYDLVKVSLFDPETQEQAWVYSEDEDIGEGTIEKMIRLPVDKLRADIGKKQVTLYHKNKDLPGYISPLLDAGIKAVVLLPLIIKQKLSGIIILGTKDPGIFSKENLAHARQLANQVAVALSNARLIEDLDNLNWGTLYALARAVDAKSPWTGNHSERVTEMAVKIGRVLKLSEEELGNLRRGALLHDIGKIGISLDILDKDGRLSEKELKSVQEHPEIGARILEPISAYTPIVPIILQHHERFDGTGYPNGLSGNKITLGARILSVADVYDALSSDRPYRSAMAKEAILENIYNESGKQFDPKILDALKIVIGSKETNGVSKPKKRTIRGLRVEEF